MDSASLSAVFEAFNPHSSNYFPFVLDMNEEAGLSLRIAAICGYCVLIECPNQVYHNITLFLCKLVTL